MNILNKIFKKLTVNKDEEKIVSKDKEEVYSHQNKFLNSNNVINHKSYYNDYLQYLKESGWICSTVELSNLSSITKINLEKDRYGSFLDIKCPAGKKLTFVGLSNVDLDIKQFLKFPNLYQYPYSFSIICKDDNGNELAYDKLIKIIKIKESDYVKNITHELYSDLNLKIDNRVKRLEERFYFKEGFELNSEEHLVFETCPDINISKIEIIGKADLFTKIT